MREELKKALQARREESLKARAKLSPCSPVPVDDHDLVALQRHRDRITPDPVPLIAVSRSGASTAHADAVFTPADLIDAW